MEDNELVKKIQNYGHWRVLIRPTEFQEKRISTLKQCEALVELNKLSLRGWDYPHIQYNHKERHQDWVDSAVDNGSYVEYWRFYQSGQFIHYAATKEETILQKRGLEIVNTIYRLTEIVEFAARLSQNGVMGNEVLINVRLQNIAGYTLFSQEFMRLLGGEYVYKDDKLEWQHVTTVTELIANSAEIAIDAVEFIFDRFGLNAQRTIWAADQQRLLERRLAV